MKTSRINEEYKNGVDHFLEFVQQNAKEMGGKYLCPCVKCGNERQHVVNGIKTHLVCDGIILSYARCIWHGQLPNIPSVSQIEHVDVDMGDRLEDMIRDVLQEYFSASTCTFV